MNNAIIIPIIDHIVLTCNSITIKIHAAQFMNRCRMFLLIFRKPQMGNIPQSLPYWDVPDLFVNRWRIWSFDPPYNRLPGFAKKRVNWSSEIKHSPSNSDHFIGIIWPQSLSSLTGPALSRLLYLGMCFSQQSIIYHQDNMELKWSWTINLVHNQPKFCLISLPNTIITLLWLIVSHLRVFTPGFWNLGSKTYMAQTCLTALYRTVYHGSNFISINYSPFPLAKING